MKYIKDMMSCIEGKGLGREECGVLGVCAISLLPVVLVSCATVVMSLAKIPTWPSFTHGTQLAPPTSTRRHALTAKRRQFPL